MKSHLVMTVLGSDRPGLVKNLADIISNHGGNWLDSRMVRMAGQFTGVIRVECPTDQVSPLLSAIRGPAIPGLTVQAARQPIETPAKLQFITVDVVGHDRPGIIKELSTAITHAGANVEELSTHIESAPMSGDPLFKAHGKISIPLNADAKSVAAAIEQISNDLTVDLS